MKKSISWIMALVMVFVTTFAMTASLLSNNVQAAGDSEKPVIDISTLTVSKTNATTGDSVVVSVKVTDNVKVSKVQILYTAPQTGVNENLTTGLMTYNSTTDRWERTIEISDTTEIGTWKVYSIRALDSSNNLLTLNSKSNDFSSGNFTVSGTTGADIVKPEIDLNTLSVSKTEATLGDTVVVSVKVTDNVEVGSVVIVYNAPESKMVKTINMTYNQSSGKYEGNFEVNDITESGVWKIYTVAATDTSSNRTIYQSNLTDLTAGNITVSGTVEADKEAPVIDLSTLTIDKTYAKAGETVTVSVKVTDNAAVAAVSFSYQSPSGVAETLKTMTYNETTGKYERVIEVTADTEKGVWAVNSIRAADNALNVTTVEASGNSELSKANYTVYADSRYNSISALSNVITIYQDTQWSDKTINQDVYIINSATLSASNCTFNGNVFVMGNLSLSNSKAKNVFARSATYALANSSKEGQVVVVTGTTITGTLSVDENYVPEIPVSVYTVGVTDGRVNMTGATLTGIKFTANGTNVDTSNEGKFILENLQLIDGDIVKMEFVAYSNATVTRYYSVSKKAFIVYDGDKLIDCKFVQGGDGKYYWYENGIKQGTYDDPQGVIGDGTVRGREIYDHATDGWYWLDSCYNGAKACSKEVWMPYIYQNEASWGEDEIITNSLASGNMASQVQEAIKKHYGKWVRYDANGKMIKGWYTVQGADTNLYPSQAGNIYYYDKKTGLMAKGWLEIDGVTYHFDENSGALIK